MFCSIMLRHQSKLLHHYVAAVRPWATTALAPQRLSTLSRRSVSTAMAPQIDQEEEWEAAFLKATEDIASDVSHAESANVIAEGFEPPAFRSGVRRPPVELISEGWAFESLVRQHLRALDKTGLLRHTDLRDRPERFFKAHRLLARHAVAHGPGFWIRFSVHCEARVGDGVRVRVNLDPLYRAL